MKALTTEQQKFTLHILQISDALTLLKPEVRKKGDIALEQIQEIQVPNSNPLAEKTFAVSCQIQLHFNYLLFTHL